MSAGQLGAAEKLALLTRTASLLASSTDFQTTLEKTIEACLPHVADFGFFDLRVDPDRVVRTARAYEDPRIEEILRPSQWIRSERTDMNLCGLSTGSSGFHPTIDDTWYVSIAVNEGHLAVLRSLAFRSMITVPLRASNEVIGALTLFYGTSGRSYTAADVAFVEELAALVVPFVINARLVERQRRVEEALRSSEERLRLAIDAGQLGIWDWNIVTDQVVWSERVYELHGLVPGSFGGRVEDFAALVHDEDRPRVQAAIEDAIAGSDSYEIEFRIAGAPHRWLATRARVIRDGAGAPLRMVGATYDVTARVELLTTERLARERLEVLARAGELLTRSLDHDATIAAITTSVTPALADWCRIDLFDDAGVLRHVVSRHADPDLARRGAALGEQSRGPATRVGTVAWVAANNEPYTAVFDEQLLASLPPSELTTFVIENRLRSFLCVPLLAHGRSLGVLSALRDDQRPQPLGPEDVPLFTELAGRAALALDNARLYAEAERARAEAEAANRAKDEFLAILGHELRNPLAPIVSALHLMEARDDHHPRERAVIQRQVTHLSRLVDDLLDVSRIVRGKVEITRTRIDLAQVVAKALEMTSPLFTQRGLRLEVALPPARAWVDGEPVRLAQVVSNLLTNAAKFSSEGGRVEVSLVERDGHHELRVRDEGIGISAELLPEVFGLFVQGPQAIHRERGGLGLGLAIVKNLVEQHGGSVEARSEGAGRGATFVIRIPAALALPAEPAAAEQADASLRAGRVLIVDDNIDAGEMLAELLRTHGYDVTFRPEGMSALEVVHVARPDVAVLDIGLPGLDGYELARRLRADESLAPLRLVALTGYGLPSDRMRTKEAGFDLHLVKPVDPTHLLAALDQLFGR